TVRAASTPRKSGRVRVRRKVARQSSHPELRLKERALNELKSTRRRDTGGVLCRPSAVPIAAGEELWRERPRCCARSLTPRASEGSLTPRFPLSSLSRHLRRLVLTSGLRTLPCRMPQGARFPAFKTSRRRRSELAFCGSDDARQGFPPRAPPRAGKRAPGTPPGLALRGLDPRHRSRSCWAFIGASGECRDVAQCWAMWSFATLTLLSSTVARLSIIFSTKPTRTTADRGSSSRCWGSLARTPSA